MWQDFLGQIDLLESLRFDPHQQHPKNFSQIRVDAAAQAPANRFAPGRDIFLGNYS